MRNPLHAILLDKAQKDGIVSTSLLDAATWATNKNWCDLNYHIRRPSILPNQQQRGASSSSKRNSSSSSVLVASPPLRSIRYSRRQPAMAL